ncbi:MAG: DEAD/DEAH box helicase [Nitrososphaerales archaeon]
MESFRELKLSPEVLRGVDSVGYRKPFPIQEKAIGPLMAGKSIVGQAKAGSGKTAAFGIPLLHAVNPRDHRVQALVLAPTRELAVQITQELKKIGAYTGINVLTIYGGQSMNVQLDALKRGVHVVVGTPGRVIDHLQHRTLRLDSVRYVVIDEADVMLDMGFIDDVDFILASTPDDRQLSLFSATMPRKIIELSERYMTDPEHILVDENELTVATLEQFYAKAERPEKFELLLQVLKKEKRGSTVIFCRTRYGTIRLAKELERRFLSVAQLHGDLSQNQRDHSMNLFRSARVDVLVATDVAARGIDVRQVGCVINYDVPEDSTVYFHRVGRTARAGDLGKAYTFVSRDESPDFARIMALTKTPIKPLRPEDEIHFSRSDFEDSGRDRRRSGRRRNRGQRGGGMKWRRYR